MLTGEWWLFILFVIEIFKQLFIFYSEIWGKPNISYSAILGYNT